MLRHIFIIGAIVFSMLAEAAPEIILMNSSVHPPKEFIAACIAALPGSKVIVKYHDSPVNESYAYSVKDLSKKNDTKQNHLGVTVFQYGSSFSYSSKGIKDPTTGLSCTSLSIESELSMKDHNVYIAKDFLNNSCLFNYIRSHEYVHVSINRKAIIDSASVLKAEMDAQFSNKLYIGDSRDISAKYESSIKQYWEPRVKSLQNQVMDLHKIIDTPAEYAKVLSACNGSIKNYNF